MSKKNDLEFEELQEYCDSLEQLYQNLQDEKQELLEEAFKLNAECAQLRNRLVAVNAEIMRRDLEGVLGLKILGIIPQIPPGNVH